MNKQEKYELAEKAVYHLTCDPDFTKHYTGLTGRKHIDPFYPKITIAIFADLINCLQKNYKDEAISLRILFQELFKIADLMDRKNLSGSIVLKEIVDLEDAIVYTEFASDTAINDTFDFIVAALYANEISGNIMEDCSFHSKLAYKFKSYDFSNERRIAAFRKSSIPIETEGMELQLELELLQKQISDIAEKAFKLGQKYGERQIKQK